MASLKLTLSLSILVLHGMLFLSYPVHCDEVEDDFYEGMVRFRESHHLPNFTKNDKAACLAELIAEQLDDHYCFSPCEYSVTPGTMPRFDKYKDLLHECKIGNKTTRDGVILPGCSRKMDPALTLSNYTDCQYMKYFNSTKYTGIGVGFGDDWMVVILSTNTSNPKGTFSSAAAPLVSKIGLGHYYMVSLLLGMLLLVSV